MKKFIKPTSISGSISAPPSKSITQRALALALLSHRQVLIKNPSMCEDAQAAMNIIQALGATIKEVGSDLLVNAKNNEIKNNVLDCGESGLCARMFAPIAALFDKEITVMGRSSLLQRPCDFLVKPLEELGVSSTTNQGFLPLKIRGPITGNTVHVDGSMSSQFLTGLLCTLPTVSHDSHILVKNLVSKPYIDLTIDLLKQWGVVIKHIDYERFEIRGNQKYSLSEFVVEGDFSNAAFLLVAAAIGGEVTVTGLRKESLQGDKAILDIIQKAGADVTILNQGITVKKNKLFAFDYDASETPDLFPPLVVLACNAQGKSCINGVNRLIHKESNRAQALVTEFTKLGADITITNDTMIIQGKKFLGGTVSSHNDHRIAMAVAIAAIASINGILIEGTDCVAKSYPSFFEDFLDIGGNVDMVGR